ncbi:MAG: hypothetical protein AAFU85_17510, partial [Planctomycetota bacterium]
VVVVTVLWDGRTIPSDDYCVHPPGDESPAAGICHARGPNAGLPAQWLMYVIVGDVEASVASCERLGGKVLVANRDMGSYGTLAIIQDPAGATLALMQPPAGDDD